MDGKENSNQRSSGKWHEKILQGSLLDQNSTLELIIKASVLLVALSWIEGHYLSWTQQDEERARLTNLGCTLPAEVMTRLELLEPEDGESEESYLIRKDEREARLLVDRNTAHSLCWK